MSNQPLHDDAGVPAFPSEPKETFPPRPRGYIVVFKNVFGEIRYIVIAPDGWSAISEAEKRLNREHNADEYPYRLALVRELEGTVLRTAGLQIPDASEVPS